jgi:hypothetical protein
MALTLPIGAATGAEALSLRSPLELRLSSSSFVELLESTAVHFFSSKATLFSSPELDLCSPSVQSCSQPYVSEHNDGFR